MVRGVDQLIDTDANTGFNPLFNGVDTFFDEMKIIQKVGGFAIKIVSRFGQFNITGIADKQCDI